MGTPLALAAIPVILVLAAAMAIPLRTWPFFVQDRIGRHGRLFRIPKIRTLPKSTPEYANKHTFDFDLSNIPRLARFMRRTHLDELPQLYLVPVGRMSLVGPRPKMPDSVEPIDPTYGRMRVQMRQGCTGLWQVGEHSHLQVAASPAYDLFYLRYGCLRLDLWILWRTLASFVGEPSVRLETVPSWVKGKGLLGESLDAHLDLRDVESGLMAGRDLIGAALGGVSSAPGR